MDTLRQFDLMRLAGTGSIDTLVASEIDSNWANRAGISVETYYVAAALVRGPVASSARIEVATAAQPVTAAMPTVRITRPGPRVAAGA